MMEYINYFLAAITGWLGIFSLVAWVAVLYKRFPSVERVAQSFDLSREETGYREESIWTALRRAGIVSLLFICSLAILLLFWK